MAYTSSTKTPVTPRLYLLGAFRLEIGKQPIRLPTRKVESLLAFLALSPQPHTREKLAALLWGDFTDEQARHSLRTALATLRKELRGDILLADRETVQLNPGCSLWVDAIAFQQSATDDPQSAIGLYQGDLLTDFYDDWILQERERLRLLYIATLLRLAQQARSHSEYARAIEFAQKVLAADPADEKAYQHIIFCHAVMGDRIGALKQYDECEKKLRDELGVEPSRETIALRDRIERELTGGKSREALFTNVPVPLTSFVGRQLVMAEVKRLLETTRLLTLTGAGGCGKTRLAIQIATDLAHANRFKNGVWWVDLAALSDPALVPQTVAGVFDLRESPQAPLIAILISYFRAKELLLVLDNCEHLVEACARLTETLLSACPQLRILMTSREALGLSGETTFYVPSLSVPDPSHLPPTENLQDYEAVRLFVERGVAAWPGFALSPGNALPVVQVCHRLDGIPLAIELAAARVRAMSVEQIATRLDDRFRLLTGGSRTALPRHQTLRALIDWSYGLLSEPERVLLSRLSVFAGGWTLEAAEAVCADDGSSPDSAPIRNAQSEIRNAEVLDLLIHLVDKSLVVMDEHRGDTRYRLLETIRQYARDRLLESDEGERVHARHLDFFLKFAEEAEPKLLGTEQLTWLNRLAADHDNLRAALAWSQGDAVVAGLRLAGALWFFWYARGYWSEWRERLTGLLARPEAMRDKAAYAKALGLAGWLVSVQGDPATGLPMLRESVALLRELGQEGRRLLAFMLAAGLGSLSALLELAEARSVSEESLAISREIGDQWIMGQALFQLGRLSSSEGNYTAERALYEEGLRVLQGTGDNWLSALLRGNLGGTLYEQGDHVAAKLYLEESVAGLRALGDKHNTATYLEALGDIAMRQGDYKRAQECFEESLAVFRELGAKRLIASALSGLGLVAQRQGNHTRALTLYKESLNLFREAGSKRIIAYTLGLFASLATVHEQAERAARLFGAAEALRESSGDILGPVERADLERDLAAVHAQLDEATFNAAWAEGRAMTLEQSIEYALQDTNKA